MCPKLVTQEPYMLIWLWMMVWLTSKSTLLPSPTIAQRPQRRVPCRAKSRPAGEPEQSIDTSQPKPPVRSLILFNAWASAGIP